METSTTLDMENLLDETNSTIMSPVSIAVNFTNTTQTPYTAYSQRLETYIVPVLFALIFIVGVLGNGTLVLIFIRHRNMRNVPNTYIFSLALGDLLVIVTFVPFTTIVYGFESWTFGEVICKLMECVKDISIGVSVFTLTALSADRFFAIVDPMRKLHTAGGGRRATRLTIMSAVFIWILAIVCAIPAAVASYIKVLDIDSNKHINVCHPFPDSWGKHYGKIMVIAKFLIYYAIPLIIISFFYLLMARHLILSTLHIPGEMQTQARQVRARKKVAKMVLAFVIVFAICFFPQHVFLLWFYSDPVAADANYNQYWHAFRIIGFCLSFINSCINPIALYCVSGTFRKHFNRYLLCNCFKKSANGRGRGMAGSNNSCRASITSRRHLGTITSSRRYAQCTKSTWDSTTMANYTSVARKQTLGNQSTEEISITTFMNGGFLGSGKEMHVEN